jgi:hypothetical protein
VLLVTRGDRFLMIAVSGLIALLLFDVLLFVSAVLRALLGIGQ